MATQENKDVSKLPAPALLAPKNGEVLDGRSVRFEWEPEPEATSYLLEVATDAGFEDVVLEQEISGRSSLTVSNVFSTDDTLYYWRVLAANEAGWSNGDKVESFIAAAPDAPLLHAGSPDESFGPLAGLARGSIAEAAGELTGEGKYKAEQVRLGVEHDRVEAGQIVGIMLAVAVAVITAVIILFQWTSIRSEAARQAAVQTVQYRELREVNAAATRKLTQYELIDPEAGIYRIPIERAMDLMVNEAYQSE